MKKIIVTGATGFLGRHLMPLLKNSYKDSDILGLSSKDFDLLKFNSVEHMLKKYQPEIIIHLAAYSGGIGANQKFPADFFFKNIQFISLMFELAHQFKVKKIICPIGGCSYPSNAKSPISEEQMWDGYPQIESAGYSVAKKMALVASESYRRQYGFDSTILIPGNMYGEYDNYRESESHVIPAMIRRYYEAKLRGDKEIIMWGDGSPVRDFVYAGDVAKVFLKFLENNKNISPVNISSGIKTSIKELAEIIKNKMKWNGEIKWDITKPNGQLVKIFDTKKLNKIIGISCETKLNDGIDKTINWFQSNYLNKTDNIRL
jgi:GDP-L-fucose synthase